MDRNTNRPVGTAGSSLQISSEAQAILDRVRTLVAGMGGVDEGSVNAAVAGAARYLNTAPPDRRLTIESLREDLDDARERASAVTAIARGTVIAAAADGWSEVSLAENLRVDRMTIRKWLGKRS